MGEQGAYFRPFMWMWAVEWLNGAWVGFKVMVMVKYLYYVQIQHNMVKFTKIINKFNHKKGHTTFRNKRRDATYLNQCASQ